VISLQGKVKSTTSEHLSMSNRNADTEIVTSMQAMINKSSLYASTELTGMFPALKLNPHIL
jgi:hypothetical protein